VIRAVVAGAAGRMGSQILAALREEKDFPVTGSASGHLALLVQRFLPGVLPRRLVFRQGDEVGRPGRVDIELRAGEGPDPIHAWVGGAATVIVRGELEVG